MENTNNSAAVVVVAAAVDSSLVSAVIESPMKKRGRPAGSKNKEKAVSVAEVVEAPIVEKRKVGRPRKEKSAEESAVPVVAVAEKKRGRPVGSKNKKISAEEVVVTEAVESSLVVPSAPPPPSFFAEIDEVLFDDDLSPGIVSSSESIVPVPSEGGKLIVLDCLTSEKPAYGPGAKPYFLNRPLREYEIEDVKSRKVGTDDLSKVVDLIEEEIERLDILIECAESAEINLSMSLRVDQLNDIAEMLTEAHNLSLEGHKEYSSEPGRNHYEAGRLAELVFSEKMVGDYELGNCEIECRDGKVRRVYNVIRWFAQLHLSVSDKVVSLHEKYLSEEGVEESELDLLDDVAV